MGVFPVLIVAVFDEYLFSADQIHLPPRVFRAAKKSDYFGIRFDPAFYAGDPSVFIHDEGHEFCELITFPVSRKQLHRRTDNCRNETVGILMDGLYRRYGRGDVISEITAKTILFLCLFLFFFLVLVKKPAEWILYRFYLLVILNSAREYISSHLCRVALMMSILKTHSHR